MEDFFRPFKRVRVYRPCRDEAVDRVAQRGHAGEAGPREFGARQDAKPDFDEVEPARVCRVQCRWTRGWRASQRSCFGLCVFRARSGVPSPRWRCEASPAGPHPSAQPAAAWRTASATAHRRRQRVRFIWREADGHRSIAHGTRSFPRCRKLVYSGFVPSKY